MFNKSVEKEKDKNVITILMLVIENGSNIFPIDRCQQITGCFFDLSTSF